MSDADSNTPIENFDNEKSFTVVERKSRRQKNNSIPKREMNAADEDKEAFDKCQKNLKLLLNNLNSEKSKLNFNVSDHFNLTLESLKFLQANAKKCKLIEIFKLFKDVLEKLYENKEYDLILQAETNFIKSINKNIFDLNVFQIYRVVAQVNNKKENYENALEIFENIQENILSKKDSKLSTDEHFEFDMLYLSFLISSDQAYTKCLMGKHQESYDGYKSLYSKLLKHIEVDEISNKTYNTILQSQKYLNILKFNANLNILQVRFCMAFELQVLSYEIHQSLEQQNNKTLHNEQIQYHEEALHILEDIYEKKENNILFYKTIRKMAFIYNELSRLYSTVIVNNTNLNIALNYCNKSFRTYNELIAIQQEGHFQTSPENIQIKLNFIGVFYNTAFIHNKFGDMKYHDRKNEAFQHFKEALKNYEKAYKFYKECSDEHEYFLSTMSSIGFTNTRLGELQSDDRPLEAIQYFKDAYKINIELYEKNRILFGEMDKKTKKTKRLLSYVSCAIQALYVSIGLNMEDFHNFIDSYKNII